MSREQVQVKGAVRIGSRRYKEEQEEKRAGGNKTEHREHYTERLGENNINANK